MLPHKGIGFVGRFKNGQVDGHFWAGMINGGFLHGKADERGLLTGNDIAYIYPDGETAFLGRLVGFGLVSSWFCLVCCRF